MSNINNYVQAMRMPLRILKQFLQKTTFLVLAIPILLTTALLASVDVKASDDIDIDRASWSSDRDRLTVRGEDARDNDTVTIRYGVKEDNGVVIGTTRADGDGDWEFRITGIDPVPCDVTAEDSRDDDDKEVRNAPRDCSNDGGNQPPANVPPTANANGPYTGTTGVAVSFSSAGSNDSDGTITAFSWDFGDGNTSNNANPSHAYAAAGTYDVTLTVTDNDGATDSDVTTATISDQPPVQACNIAVSPTTLAFGDVTLGNSLALSTTVSNSGNAACNVTLALTGSIDFAITSNTSFNVSAGGSQNVSVSYTPAGLGADAGTLAVNSNDPDTATVNVDLSGNGVDQQVVECIPVTNGLSINSTSQDGCPEQTVPEANTVLNSAFRVLAINDLGMHCGDLDTRISSILPPFQVLLGQVIQRGATPTLNPAGVIS